jgi:hypothetical protein
VLSNLHKAMQSQFTRLPAFRTYVAQFVADGVVHSASDCVVCWLWTTEILPEV